jgi:hypothetical protein
MTPTLEVASLLLGLKYSNRPMTIALPQSMHHPFDVEGSSAYHGTVQAIATYISGAPSTSWLKRASASRRLLLKADWNSPKTEASITANRTAKQLVPEPFLVF